MLGGAAKRAAGAQMAGITEGIDQLKGSQGSTDAAFAPYLASGLKGLGARDDALGLNGAQASSIARSNFTRSPGYQFQLGEGLDAIDSSAASRGGLLSGGTLRDVNTFGQGLANQEWGSYLNQLGGVANEGQAAVTSQGAINSRYAEALAGLFGDRGTAKATGIIGANNQRAGLFSDLLGAAGGTNFFGLGGGGAAGGFLKGLGG